MSAAAISVRGIGKHFGMLSVLDNIGFEVGEGEIVALLGASGCGKSTLLNIVAGLAAPDTGELWLNGERAPAGDRRRPLAYMFQEDRLLPWRTARANAEFAHGVPANTTEFAVLASSPVKTLADLNATKIGVTAFTWGTIPGRRAAQREAGLVPGEYVNDMAVGALGAGFHALKTGAVDALNFNSASPDTLRPIA